MLDFGDRKEIGISILTLDSLQLNLTSGCAECAEHGVGVVEPELVEVELLDAEHSEADVDPAARVAGVCLGNHLREEIISDLIVACQSR